MNNITYSRNSIANPSNREKTDRELYLEAKSLLNAVLTHDEEPELSKKDLINLIKQFLKK